MTAVLQLTRDEAEAFLVHEAELLDTLRFHDWFELLTDDIRYSIPTAESVQGTNDRFHETDDRGQHFGIMDETKDTLWLRVRQLDTGLRHVETPASITDRLIGNVIVEPVADRDGEALVRSKFVLVQLRHGTHQSLFSGRRIDRLRWVDGRLMLARRRVELTQTVLPRAISIFF